MLLSSITLGLIFGLVTLGTWLTSQVIKFDDLSIEGSFCVGGALTAQLFAMHTPIIATVLIVILSGMCAGLLTTALHNTLGINNLLCGILTNNIMFSASLLIAGANMSLLNIDTLLTAPSGIPSSWWTILVLGICVIIACTLLHWLLSTEIGLLIRTLGSNKSLIINLGKRPALFEAIAIGLANVLAAVAGSLFVQIVGFFSIWSSVGIMVISLASLMLGQLLGTKLPALILGSIALQALIALAFDFNVQPELHKLISAGLIIIFTIISHIRRN